MKVSLIFTVLNEATTIDRLLAAIDAQTRQPDEVVIADGGSTDGTLTALRRWAAGRSNTTVLELPGSNIAAGRNAAIKAAAGPLIAVTDAGCTPDPEWLAKLEGGFGPGIDVVMGYYRPDAQTRFERMVGCLNLPEARDVDPARFMPSSRSIAFTKRTWEAAGGYPEWLDVGEDMYFNFRVIDRGAARKFVPDAMVAWRLRPGWKATWRQYFRYGEGDGRAGMYPRRHALRFATYTIGLISLGMAVKRPRLLWVLWMPGFIRMGPAYVRAWKMLHEDEAKIAFGYLPVLELMLDLAKMSGYLAGRFRSRPANR